MIVSHAHIDCTAKQIFAFMRGERMTIDEAIRHAEEVAEGYEKIKRIKAVTLEECKCAEEHRQLAEWLKELKMYREMIPSASEVFSAEIRKEKA